VEAESSKTAVKVRGVEAVRLKAEGLMVKDGNTVHCFEGAHERQSVLRGPEQVAQLGSQAGDEQVDAEAGKVILCALL
jgi:hypothetical protein